VDISTHRGISVCLEYAVFYAIIAIGYLPDSEFFWLPESRLEHSQRKQYFVSATVRNRLSLCGFLIFEV
jgi:hypothetical protein